MKSIPYAVVELFHIEDRFLGYLEDALKPYEMRMRRKQVFGIYISSKDIQDILDLKPEESRLVIDKARNDCREILVRRLSEAEEKFRAYRDHLKVVVLECYGPWWALDENDVAIFLSQEALPPLIDQIWVAIQDWVSEWDYEIGYKRLR